MSKRLPKLVHVTTVPESLSFFIGQVSYLKRKGIDVYAVSSPGELLKPFLESEQVPFYPIEMQRRISPLDDIPAIRKLYTYFRRLQPDIVQVQTPKAGLLGIIAAWMARTPVRIYNVLGLRMMTAGVIDKAILRMTERVSCALATDVWCVSHSVREVMIAEKLCRASKIKVLRSGSVNGIDSQGRFNPAKVPPELGRHFRRRYNVPTKAPLAGFLGRIVRDKGVVELAEAWKTVRNNFEQAHLILVGTRESGGDIPDDVWRDLSGDPRVHITGHIKDSELPAFLAAIDMLILPTYREGFPVVPLEAAAMEVPVVATRVPGCIDAVVDGVTGTLVIPRDATDLARAIGRYLTDPDLRRDHGLAGRARVVKEFAQEPLWESIYQEYSCALQRYSTQFRRPPKTLPENEPADAHGGRPR